MIEQGVKDVYTSENFINYLQFMSRFHSYSLNNCILIFGQYPNASLVAGYNSWNKNFHRHVNKGEKGIKILAPTNRKVKRLVDKLDLNGNVVLDEQGNTIKEEVERNQTSFIVVSVFDVSQTNGEPLPQLVHNLEGSSIEVKALISTIEMVANIPVEFVDPSFDEDLKAGVKGYYSRMEDKIVVNKDLDDLQIAKTLVHEYAHSILHKDTDKEHNRREIEAESLAFVICNYFGIDTSDYSFGYIASYANENYDKLKEILADIQSNAHELIETIEPMYKEKLMELRIGNEYISPVEMEKISKDLITDLVNDIKQVDLYEQLQSITPEDVSLAKESVETEVEELLYKYKEKYSDLVLLYSCNSTFRDGLNEAVYQRCTNEQSEMHPFIEASSERKIYLALEQMAKPVLNGDSYYMKFETGGMMDFNVETLCDDRIALSHYGELNGDLMADPDVVCKVDNEHKMLIPETYQNDYLNVYETSEQGPRFIQDMNVFMQSWMKSLHANQYKVKEIYLENEQLNIRENEKEIYKYCKENGIQKFARDPKHKEEHR